MTNASSSSADSSSSLPDAIERVAASVVGIVTRRSSSAGVLWRENVLIGSASALWRASRVSLVLPNGEQVQGEVRGIDGGTDLAAISLVSGAMPVVGRAAGKAPRVGDFVFAVGRDSSDAVQASFGHIGSVAGRWRTWRGGSIDALIRLDGGLYAGFEGAPVADASGQVIGIASSAFSRRHAVVIPASTIDGALDDLLAHGRIQYGYVGVALQPARTTLDGKVLDGLLVSSVAEDGPAAKAGLLVGDVMIEVAGHAVASLDDLRDSLTVGATLEAIVVRGGQRHAVSLVVAPRPRSELNPRCGPRGDSRSGSNARCG